MFLDKTSTEEMDEEIDDFNELLIGQMFVDIEEVNSYETSEETQVVLVKQTDPESDDQVVVKRGENYLEELMMKSVSNFYIIENPGKQLETKNNGQKKLMKDRSNNLEDIKLYLCNLCNKSNSNKPNLRKHVRLIHDKDLMYSCSHCAHTTFHLIEMKKHIRSVHATMCYFKTLKSVYLTYHEKIRHQDKESNIMQCDKCGFETNRKDTMYRHVKSVHDKELKYVCSS
jgi:hypothetical protein